MFSNPSPIDNSIQEATITEIDTVRRMYKVKTQSGQNLQSVTCYLPVGGSGRGGDRITGGTGDKVLIHTGLGNPVIIQFLPKLQSAENLFPPPIDTGELLVDTGNFSSAGNTIIGDQNAPRDMLAGDRIISSPGGGLVGILRAGSVLLRSSRLAEIYLCKWDDLVRVVSRNWEHYTDVSSDIIKNIGGRIYRYTGYAKDVKDAKVEDYKYHQYIGDVSLAELAKTDYASVDSPPAPTQVIYKEQITTGSGGSSSELLHREIYLDGKHDLVVKNSDGSIFTRIQSTNGEVKITYKDVNVITIDATHINITKEGDPTINLDSSGIQATFNGHFVRVHSGGVALG